MKKRKGFIALLSVFAVSSATVALAAGCDGCGKATGIIDAPASLEEELGAYVIPDYDVIDANGMVLAGYNVYLKSVITPDGEELADSYGSAVTVDEAGVYSFVYSAGSKKVKDVTVSIDFADRTAPTINCDDSTIPKFFIKNNSYKVPQYTLSGDFVREKCWAKVFYVAEDKTETQVKVDGGRFLVDKDSGSYAIRIHVEDAAGNANDYEYVRKVDGPATIVENKVLYLDEEFGEKQVSCYQSAYTGGFVSKDAEGAHAYGDENGAYKVSFNGETETRYNEGLIVMDVPAIIDINEYENLYMYVYNNSENDIIMGSQWWNDTKVEKGKWTKLTWNTRAWGNNVSANNIKPIGLVDISGMTIRFIFDYGQKVIPNGDFYLSAMYATPKIKSELEAGENVILNSSKYYVNDVAELNAAPVDGKTVDYYKVDGEIIPGSNFIVTAEQHKIEVVYKDGELTKDGMTWAQPDEFTVQGSDAQWQTMGVDDYFAYTFDIYGAEEDWCYAGVQVGGNGQLLGFEISAASGKFAGYGGSWKWGDGVKLTAAQYKAIRGATQTDPVKAILVRRGTEIRAYLAYGDKLEFIASVDNATLGISENRYGYGQRKRPANISHNVSVVGGETKTLLYFEEFAAQLTVDGEKSEEKHYLGDKVSITAAAAPEGKMFAYFKVNGGRINGNSFVITSFETSVETVYTDIATVTLAEGIKTADGKTGTVQAAKDTYLELDFTGTAPAGKYFTGFTVDGVAYVGSNVYISGDTHEIGVLFAEKIQTGADKLNDISDAEVLYAQDDDGNDKWKPASVEHVTDFRFDGSDGAVDENSVLKIVTGNDSGENSFAFDNSLVKNLDTYSEIYFYVYTNVSGMQAGGWWCNDTDLVAGKWTKVTFRRTDSKHPGTIDGNGEDKVWEAGLEKFAFRIFKAPANTTVYVTAVYGLPYPDANVTVAEDSTDKLTVSAPLNGEQYKVGETVTLTVKGDVPAGQLFAYFTANGTKFEGNTYVLTGDVEFGAVYNDISELNMAEGIRTSDGRSVYARDVKVTLVFEGALENGKVFNYFTVDGRRITGDTFVTTRASHTVAAVFADGAKNLTWVIEAEANESSVSYSWDDNAYKFNGKSVEQGTHWAIKAVITELPYFDNGHDRWYGFDFLVGTNASIQIRIHTSGIFMVQAMGTHHGDGADIGAYLLSAAEVVKACKAVSADNPVTFTAVREGDTYYVLFNGQLAVKSNYDFKTADDKFGIGKSDCPWLPECDITYSYRTGASVTEYLTTASVSAADGVSLDKTEKTLKLGETVTLTAVQAPEGQKFVSFTANGVPFDGDKFVVKCDVEFGVIFNEVSEITLGSGVAVDGEEAAEGRLTVGKGAVLTLVYNGDIPTGKYFVGFKADGKPVEGNSFEVTAAEHIIEAVLADKIQTGSVKLNEISTVETDGLTYHSNESWKPEKIEFVTDFRYTGSDGAVDESGSLKITLKGEEQSFALNKTLKNGLDDYQALYFYAYTEASGVMAGGWWCNDTELVAGKWTKVTFGRTDPKRPTDINDNPVWDKNSVDKFAYRIKGASAGDVVYVTAIYGELYDEVSVTVDESVKDYVTVSGIFRENQTVTLSHSGAPAGQAFAYFTVNREKHTGDTLVLGKDAVVIGAVFSDISTVSLADGVTADGAENGKITVGRGATVKLAFDASAAPQGEIFDYFTVDGVKINGDTFVTTKASHTVAAVFADGAKNLTWVIEAEAEESPVSYSWDDNAYKFNGKSVGESTHWAINAVIIELPNFDNVNDQWYGFDFLVGTNASMQIRMHTSGIFTVYAMGSNFSDGVEFNDYYADTAKIIAACKAVSAESPVTFTAVREGGTYYVLFNGELVLKKDYDFKAADDKFGIGKSDCPWLPECDSTYSYRTGAAATEWITKAKVGGSGVIFDKDDGIYQLGETVRLTAAAAPEGKKFAYFVVNDKQIEGDSFVAIGNTYTVRAEYSDISTLTLAKGVTTADGNKEYARGVKVKLSYDPAALNGKVVDYYIIDKGTEDEQKIFGDEFTTSKATHTVEAALAEPSGITWVKGGEQYNYETVMGAAASEWKSRALDGEVYGQAEYWAVSVDVTYDSGWKSLEFIQGSKQSIRIRVEGGGWCGIVLMTGKDTETVPTNDFNVAWASSNAVKYPQVVNKLKEGATVTCVRNGDTITMYVDGLLFFTTTYAVDHTDNWFGVGHVTANDATKPTMSNTKFIAGQSKVEAFLNNLRVSKSDTQKSQYQLNNIAGATVKDNSVSEYITTGIPEGLDDANVKENGVLKVTAKSADVGLTAGWTFDRNVSRYSEIYFWVYIESEEDLAHVAGGAYWQDGVNAAISKNKWTKISFNADLIAKLNSQSSSTLNNDLQNFVFRVYSQTWLSGYTDITGKTFYITSLYGVPEGDEPLAENEATSYSLVNGGDDELEAILNDNFFPDAE